MSLSYHDIEQFILREARYLDDRDWDRWLECYHPDVTYWMPAWDDNEELTEDPQNVPKYTLVLLLIVGIVLAVVLEDASLAGVRLSMTIPQFIMPEWNLASTLSLAIPLVLVSLTGQFLPGMAILQGAGYRVKAKPVIAISSLISLPMALFGGITTVVAAITAAICTGKDAHEEPSKRYVAGVVNGVFYLVGGLFAGTIVALFTSLPAAFVAVLAGLALLGAIANNLFAALEDPSHREASLITFIVTASGLSLFGLSSAFWGVVIGYGCFQVLNTRSGEG